MGGGLVNTVTVSEIFGPTIQGEGPSMGKRAAFVRLGRCNLNCSWCDTPFTWDWTGQNGTVFDPSTELASIPVGEVADTVREMGVRLLVVTGGEPMIQQRKIPELVDLLDGITTEVETNATIVPIDTTTNAVTRYNLSPKLANSGIPHRQRISDEAIAAYLETGKAILKFVVQTAADVEEIEHLTDRHNIDPDLVWIMPEGRTQPEIMAASQHVMEQAISHRWNYSSRLHVLGWGDRRSV